MKHNLKAKDTNPHIPVPFKTVWFRSDELKKQVGASKWWWLNFLDVCFGSELLENFVIVSGSPTPDTITDQDKHVLCGFLHLIDYIPGGFITHVLRNHLVELLFFKYNQQYKILAAERHTKLSSHGDEIDFTRCRFGIRKELLYQFITLRRHLDLVWLITNLCVDILFYLYFKSLQAAIISALTIEGLRRMIRSL